MVGKRGTDGDKNGQRWEGKRKIGEKNGSPEPILTLQKTLTQGIHFNWFPVRVWQAQHHSSLPNRLKSYYNFRVAVPLQKKLFISNNFMRCIYFCFSKFMQQSVNMRWQAVYLVLVWIMHKSRMRLTQGYSSYLVG